MLNTLDLIIFRWFNSWAGISPFFDWAIRFRAVYLWYVVMGAVLLFSLAAFIFPKFRQYRRRNLELLIFTFFSAFIARFMVTEFVRFLYNRPRPFEALGGVSQLVDKGIVQLIDHAGGGSFPSGHASLAFAVATAISFYYPKTSILFFLAAISIGFGRVAAGVHWPSDILGGAIVGIATVWIIRLIFKKSYKKMRLTE